VGGADKGSIVKNYYLSLPKHDNTMKQLAVGIDIGGTNSVYGLVDREGNI
jgi:hypothetical protein